MSLRLPFLTIPINWDHHVLAV